MGQRHQSRRRRSYGRRQHEVRERRNRREPLPADVALDPGFDDSDATQSFGDLFSGRFRLAEGT